MGPYLSENYSVAGYEPFTISNFTIYLRIHVKCKSVPHFVPLSDLIRLQLVVLTPVHLTLAPAELISQIFFFVSAAR